MNQDTKRINIKKAWQRRRKARNKIHVRSIFQFISERRFLENPALTFCPEEVAAAIFILSHQCYILDLGAKHPLLNW